MKIRRTKGRISLMTSQNEYPSRPGIGWFAREVLGRPLYPYQEIIGDAILDSVVNNRGYTITVMLARQMGKNQLSAILETYLLFAFEQGSIVKAAPTFRPQIGHSHQRLLQMFAKLPLHSRLWKSSGSIIGLAPTPQEADAHVGPYVHFLSAGPESNIVGATASLLLEIDEAQAVTMHKYDVELKPMASTTAATTVLYGTAWSDDTLLARMRAYNLELERQDGIRRHFEFDWTHLAALNKRYKNFVEAEIARLGKDHLSIRTQYRLQPISGANLLLNDLQRRLVAGTHQWQSEPDDECYYIAGLDIGGEERPDPLNEEARGSNPVSGKHRASKRDSTVLTIGRVTSNEFSLPSIEIVHQCWWTGMGYLEQFAALSELAESWNLRRLIVDQTGLGEMLASLLIKKLGAGRVGAFHFTRPAKSALTYHFLAMINTGRLKLYSSASSPPEVFEECWKQLSLAHYALPGGEQMTMHVDPGDGHDDFLMSIALCCEAVKEKELAAPDFASVWIRPRSFYDDGPY